MATFSECRYRWLRLPAIKSTGRDDTARLRRAFSCRPFGRVQRDCRRPREAGEEISASMDHGVHLLPAKRVHDPEKWRHQVFGIDLLGGIPRGDDAMFAAVL